MTPVILFAALLSLSGCDAVSENLGALSSDNDAEGRLPSDPADQLDFKGELAYGDRAWTPTECVWGTVEGRRGMIFANRAEQVALAVWKEGVPEGESNVWFVDETNPPADGNYEVGGKRCGKIRVPTLEEEDTAHLTGATKLGCGEHTGELRFKNCPNTEAGAAAASTAWPPR